MIKITNLADITARRERAGGSARVMRNGKSGKVALFVADRPWLDEDGQSMPVWKSWRQGRSTLMTQGDLDESHWADTDVATFDAVWQDDAAEAAAQPHIERLFLSCHRAVIANLEPVG